MRIAQVSTLYESAPRSIYGGTERVVSWHTERLVEAGHKVRQVTLFASADSVTGTYRLCLGSFAHSRTFPCFSSPTRSGPERRTQFGMARAVRASRSTRYRSRRASAPADYPCVYDLLIDIRLIDEARPVASLQGA